MSTESKVDGLRAEISKRMRDAATLRDQAAQLLNDSAVDKSIAASTKAKATDEAVTALTGKLRALLPTLAEERVDATLPAMRERAEKRILAATAEAEKAAEAFRALFRAWNGLQETAIGKAAATQLLGDFQPRVLSAATDRTYQAAIGQHLAVIHAEIEKAATAEQGAAMAKIRREVEALATISVAAPEEAVA